MKAEYKICGVSALFGLLFWIIDAAVDFFVYSDRPYFDLLVLHVPPHRICIRAVVFGLFLLFGLVLSLYFSKKIKSEETYRKIFSESPVGIFQTTTDGDVKAINHAMADIVGFDTVRDAVDYYHDLGGQLYVSPEKREEFIRLIGSQGFVKDFVYEARKKDGTHIWLSMTASLGPENQEGKRVINGYTADITEKVEAETAARESETKYTLLYNSIPDAILVTDGERHIIDCNAAFSNCFGYGLDEIRGSTPRMLYSDDEEYHRIGERLKTYRPGETFVDVMNFRKKTGAIFPGETSFFALQNSQGDSIGFMGLIRDISRRVKAEETLQKKVNQLEEFNKFFVNRENRMVELKKEVDTLRTKLGRDKKYHG